MSLAGSVELKQFPLNFPDALAPCAGSAIAEHVLNSSYFKSSKRLGIYLHCAALREVDTTLLVDAALNRGAL